MPRDITRTHRELIAEQDERERAARRKHPGAEPSDPPPPPNRHTPTDWPESRKSLAEWPPEPITDRRPGRGNPSAYPGPPHTTLGQLADKVKTIGGAVMFVGGAAMAAFGWAESRASDKLRAQLDFMAIAPPPPKPGEKRIPTISDRFDAIDAKLDALAKVKAADSPNNPQSELGTKLDRIDKILSEQFGRSTKTTPPPVVGPTARSTGRQ